MLGSPYWLLLVIAKNKFETAKPVATASQEASPPSNVREYAPQSIKIKADANAP
jgi:hypothetical protein